MSSPVATKAAVKLILPFLAIAVLVLTVWANVIMWQKLFDGDRITPEDFSFNKMDTKVIRSYLIVGAVASVLAAVKAVKS